MEVAFENIRQAGLYTLTRDPEAQSTYVNEGYFGIQLNE